VDNHAVADQLERFAGLLDLADANPYAVRAYRRAAEAIRASPLPVAELVRSGRARELRGVGSGVEARLRELVETGSLRELEELQRSVRPELVGLAQQLGIRTSRMITIAETLGISSAAQFREAAASGALRSVPGIGEKTEARLLAALDRPRPRRVLTLPAARDLCERVAKRLGGIVAGDVRRWRDECEALAIVVASDDLDGTLARFEACPEVLALTERSDGGATGATTEGIALQLLVAPPHRVGTTLLDATGAPAYVDALGALPEAGTEALVYSGLGLPWCPPELRERAFVGEPPPLVELHDIRGDLHMHTTWSDGKASVLEMAEAARARGYDYVAICDHTPSVGAVPGLTADDLRRQGEEIEAANDLVGPLRILRGVECDIRRDGTLDLPDDVLAELDWVQLSLHAGQRAPAAELTARVTEAMRHPAVRCLSHPTGRIVNHRPPNALDLARVLELALETGVALEVNGLPDRLDLTGEHSRLAVEAGVALVVSTDAHSTRGLDNMELAVATARRGWATPADVLNTTGPAPPLRNPR
jgi:DNA polymerase (family 10)